MVDCFIGGSVDAEDKKWNASTFGILRGYFFYGMFSGDCGSVYSSFCAVRREEISELISITEEIRMVSRRHAQYGRVPAAI